MKSSQQGQAMLEFFVAAAFVLVPLIFMVAYLGKTGDVQHRAYEGARYAAWERAITDKSDQAISSEINKRVLYGLHRDVDSEKDRLDNNNDAEKIEKLYWHTNDEGSYEGLMVSTEGSFVDEAINNKKPDSDVHQARSSLLNSGLVGYNLNERGMMSAMVNYELAGTRHLGLAERLTPSAKNVMYIENWKQVSHKQVVAAIDKAVLGAKAFDDDIFDMAIDLAAALGFEEFEHFELGYIKPDVVPCSRVVGGGDYREAACDE